MTDREERQHVIEVLQKMVDWMEAANYIVATPERRHALLYAIASIETDLKYDLLYEETSGQKEPTTEACETCRYYGSHNGVCDYCYKCSLWTEGDPTTKNDVPDINVGKIEPTTKNDLALIHTWGLDEEIRCTMCTNSMKSDRGCDGGCVVNKDMYKAVMDAIEKRIQSITKNNLAHCQCTDAEIAKSFIEDVEAVKEQLPCGEQMDFPSTFDEFAKDYGFKDKDEIYTNGSELIPVFRVKQWLEHISTTKKDLAVDPVDRRKLLKIYEDRFIELEKIKHLKDNKGAKDRQLGVNYCINVLKELPSVTPQEPNTWSLDDAREDFTHDVYNILDFLPTNEEVYRIIDSFDRVTSSIEQEPIEKCKWIKYDHRTMCPKEHIDVDSPYWRIPENRMETLKYCPYCGKEIEVEE